MVDGCRDVINRLPKKLLWTASQRTGDVDLGAGYDILGGVGLRVLQVLRKTTISEVVYYIPCREIPLRLKFAAGNSNSLHYATQRDPVYWREARIGVPASTEPKLYILPVTAGSATGKVDYVSYPTASEMGTDLDGTAIGGFPDDLEDFVIFRTVAFWHHREATEALNDIATAATFTKPTYDGPDVAVPDWSDINDRLDGEFSTITYDGPAQDVTDWGSIEEEINSDDAEVAANALARARAQIDKFRANVERGLGEYRVKVEKDQAILGADAALAQAALGRVEKQIGLFVAEAREATEQMTAETSAEVAQMSAEARQTESLIGKAGVHMKLWGAWLARYEKGIKDYLTQYSAEVGSVV